MNKYTIKALLTAAVLMLSPTIFAATWQNQAVVIDGTIQNLVPPGGSASQYTYQQYIQDQINSLSGFAPIPPFWQCSLASFQLNKTNDGITMVTTGSGNGCNVGANAGGASGPTGAGGTASGGPNGIVGTPSPTNSVNGLFQ